MTQVVLVSLGAGAASALLFSAIASGKAFSIGLFYLTPLPILLAGLAWSHLAGLIAVATAAIVLGAVLGRWFFLIYLIAIGLPSYVLAYLALLARPVANGGGEKLEWYPPGRLVLAAALLAAIATALTIPALGSDIESYRDALKAAFEQVLRAQSGTPAGEPLKFQGVSDPAAMLELLAAVIPPAAAALSMVTSLANLWLAGRIARASGKLTRPWPDLGAIRFPNTTPLVLLAAIAVSFLPNLLGLIASIVSATLLVAYVMLGFCIVHMITRSYPARTLILSAVWLAVLLVQWPVPWPFFLIALIGLADPIIDFRSRIAPGGPPNPPTVRPPNE